MAQVEPGARVRPVQLRAQHGPHVAHRDLQRVGRCALRLPGDIVRGPGEDDGCGGVDARGGENGADVAGAGGIAWDCEQNDVADNRHGRADQDEGRAPTRFLRQDCYEHCQAGGDGVGWHG